MLRITYTRTPTERRWTLCGQLAGPWIAELRQCWEHGRHDADGAQLIVDLTDVTFIDEKGEVLLSDLGSAGASFAAAGIDTRHLLENLKAKGKRPLRRMIAPQGQADQCTRKVNGDQKHEKPL
jgi:hypothetical protein